MNRTYEIIIDFENPRYVGIALKRGDKGATTLRFILMWDGKAMDMENVAFATIKGVKPDNTIIFADAEIKKDREGNNTNVIEYTLLEEAASVAGKANFELVLQGSKLEQITSFDFYVSVENLLYDENDYISANDLSGFRAYMTRALQSASLTEAFADSFRKAYGDETELLQMTQEEYEHYQQYLAELKQMVADGKLNGARGEQGERGADGVISDVGIICSFQIVNGDLVVKYANGDSDDFYIDENGDLILRG